MTQADETSDIEIKSYLDDETIETSSITSDEINVYVNGIIDHVKLGIQDGGFHTLSCRPDSDSSRT